MVDRSDQEPWRRSLLTSTLIGHLRDHDRRVVCVLNTTGRARLLACRRCRALARCERCEGAVAQIDPGELVCGRCGAVRPAVCLECGSSAFANLRPGVTRLAEELTAAAGRPAVTVTGADPAPPPDAGLYVGTEAVLHRVPTADVVAFLDFDREMLAPRYRANERAMALLVRAARLVGPRRRGGRIVVQTLLPGHEVIRAALVADPGRLAEHDALSRQALGLPPYRALAAVSGAAATSSSPASTAWRSPGATPTTSCGPMTGPRSERRCSRPPGPAAHGCGSRSIRRMCDPADQVTGAISV